jgi:hypothetical protein
MTLILHGVSWAPYGVARRSTLLARVSAVRQRPLAWYVTQGLLFSDCFSLQSALSQLW